MGSAPKGLLPTASSSWPSRQHGIAGVGFRALGVFFCCFFFFFFLGGGL